jgi:FAD/FMN-containing dehydrogenase
MASQQVRTLSGGDIELDEETVHAFTRSVRGAVLRDGEPGYDEARRIWNGMIDRRPALIARCRGTADVAACVRFASARSLYTSVKGGGHNVAGSAVCHRGLMIDLSLMKGIHVDPSGRTVRAEAGATWGDVDRETQLFGLATPGGEVSTTGIAGFTLAGGMGILRRKWGLACDNLVSAQVVTAAGEVVTASAKEHPDLFWALRGGGGNFGIVTSFELGLHPLGPEVYALTVVHPLEQALPLLRAWYDFSRRAPDEVTSMIAFWGMPPLPDVPPEMHGAPIVLFNGMYAGPAAEGAEAFRTLRELGVPIADLSGPTRYVASQSELDALFPEGGHYYWKSLFLDGLDEARMTQIVARASARPTPQTLLALRHLGGAMGRVAESATAYGNRHAELNLSLDATWEDPSRSGEVIAWTRDAWQELKDLTGGEAYLNFAGLGEDNDALARGAYRENYDRLREIKRRYDPANLFRSNVNVAP